MLVTKLTEYLLPVYESRKSELGPDDTQPSGRIRIVGSPCTQFLAAIGTELHLIKNPGLANQKIEVFPLSGETGPLRRLVSLADPELPLTRICDLAFRPMREEKTDEIQTGRDFAVALGTAHNSIRLCSLWGNEGRILEASYATAVSFSDGGNLLAYGTKHRELFVRSQRGDYGIVCKSQLPIEALHTEDPITSVALASKNTVVSAAPKWLFAVTAKGQVFRLAIDNPTEVEPLYDPSFSGSQKHCLHVFAAPRLPMVALGGFSAGLCCSS